MTDHTPGCTGKGAFDTAARAERYAAKMRRDKHGRLAAYHCKACHLWHIGGLEDRAEVARAAQYKRAKRAGAMDGERA